jgi:putative radical SAM enzyme (TIGR03279 family)
VIAQVAEKSPFDRAGIVPGDVVLEANGRPVSDVIDWQWISDGSRVEVSLSDAQGARREVSVDRGPGEGWGVGFASSLFDGVRTCRNDCAFCFMAQLPPGLRDTLYLRDDDFRLSFLDGNFITLTNLSDADVDRIIEQRLSPLYVSLHSTDAEVRASLVCSAQDRALEFFDRLVKGGIDLHVQIVLVPGVNDAERLEETLGWLAEREGVESVGIVPLGYTRYQSAFTRSYEDPAASAQVISQVQRWQFAVRERDSRTWVYLADEFYLNARAPFPTAEWYDSFPQYENGIGLVRAFADEAADLREQLAEAVRALPDCDAATLVTSMMAATTIAGALGACEAAGKVRLLVVPNRFFGGNVSVTGLVTGRDVADAISQDGNGGVYILPDVMFNSDGLTLDDMTFDEVAERAGQCVRLVSSDAPGLLAGLRQTAEKLGEDQ